MFEGKVLELVKKYLDRYVENLDGNVLQVGLLSGSVVLTDLQLRPEALCELELPIEVKAGCIGKITIEVPSWTSLSSKPVQCCVEDVLILAGPTADRPYIEDIDAKLERALKSKKLEILERIPSAIDDSESKSSFLQKLVTTILNNIQVSVQRIHIRFEDSVSRSEHATACGFMLQEASVETTNEQWRPEWVGDNVSVVHKLVHVHNLSMYWNAFLPEQSLIRNKLHTDAWKNLLKTSIGTHRIMDEDFDFLIRPISISVRLALNRDETDEHTPLVDADVAMDELEVLVSRQQFLSVLCTHEFMKVSTINQRYRKYTAGLHVKSCARACWKYAIKAVVEEFVRPFSWKRISEHRLTYRQYKDLYKHILTAPDDERLTSDAAPFEAQLDVANIIMAREHAKLELSNEIPDKVTKQKSESSWYHWLWGASMDSTTDDELVIVNNSSSTSLPQWFQSLKPEERETLCRGIGYSDGSVCSYSSEYVAEQFHFSLSSFSLSLINYGREVLKVSLAKLDVCCKNRPKSQGFRASVKTESFKVEGLSVENELMQVITSDIGLHAPPSTVKEVFNIEVEQKPLNVVADFSLKLNVQPVELVYDERAVTEMMAFFQTPQLSVEDVKNMAQTGFQRIARFSRAGLLYAIEQHKTVSLSVNMRSPYIVIPEYGTLHRGGNVVIIDFGKLKVESELQPKNVSLDDCTLSEVEALLYDKFIITVSDIKLLLADSGYSVFYRCCDDQPINGNVAQSTSEYLVQSGDDWHTALTIPDSRFHIVPSVTLQFSMYNTVQSNYKRLPRHKLESRMATLKVHLSDEKLRMLVDVCRHVPMPHSNSMIGLDDSIDGHIEPVFTSLDESRIQMEPSLKELLHIRHSVICNSVVHRSRSIKEDQLDNRASAISAGSEYYFSASDHSDDEVDDWTKFAEVTHMEDQACEKNPVLLFARVVIGGLFIELSQLSKVKAEVPYLMLRLDRACVDVTLAEFTVGVQAQLGSLQLIDKQNLGSTGEYLEILGFRADTDVMSLNYKKVSPQFAAVEDVAVQSAREELATIVSGLRVIFDRDAMLSLNSFVQNVLQSIQSNQMPTSLHKSHSTICSASAAADPYPPEAPSFIDRLSSQEGCSATMNCETMFRLVAILKEVHIQLSDHDNELAHIVVRGLEGQVLVKQSHSTFQVRLSDLSLDDRMDSTLHSRIISIDDDNAFDFKFVKRRNVGSALPRVNDGDWKSCNQSDGSVTLRVGRIQTVIIYKFFTQLQSFFQPFIEPEVIRSYSMAAQNAVYNKIQDMHDRGTWISLHIDIHAPVVIVPQHPESTNVFHLRLGDLRVKNCLDRTECGKGVFQMWDRISLSLDDLQITRGKLTLTGNIEPIHNVMEPVGLNIELKRALRPHLTELHYDVVGKLHNVTFKFTVLDLTVAIATLSDNFLDVSNKADDVTDMTRISRQKLQTFDPLRGAAVLDATTPVVEIEEPLLSTTDMVDGLLEQTRFTVDMEGINIQLLSQCFLDTDVPNSPTTRDDGEGLASLSIGKMNVGGLLCGVGVNEFVFSMKSLTVKDIRPHSDLAVKRLVQSSMPDASPFAVAPPMIDFCYNKTKDGSQQVVVNFDTVRLNVSAMYILIISDFFAKPFRQCQELFVDHQTAVIDPNLHRNADETDCHFSSSASSPMTISAKLKQCEVVLFAEPTKSNSRVLLIKANASYDLVHLQDLRHSEMKIKQLQVISCLYGLSAQTASMELYPCSIEYQSQYSDSARTFAADVCVSDVIMQISSASVQIAMDIVHTVRKSISVYSSASDASTNITLQKVAPDSAMSELWTVKNLLPEMWLNSGDVSQEVKKGEVCVKLYDPPLETLKVEANKVLVVYEVRSNDCYVPALSLATSVHVEVHEWSRQLQMKTAIHLELNCYNDKLGVWEPLIEPVADGSDSHRPWMAVIKLVRAPSRPITCTTVDLKFERQDAVDGPIHDSRTKNGRRPRSDADSSESETDSETDMTVIKPRTNRRPGSHSSFDSVSRHSSVQGESDSEPEVLTNLSSTLHNILSSDSGDESFISPGFDIDNDDDDDDAFDSAAQQPVFLTAIGPVSATVENGGEDEVDGPELCDEDTSLCNYFVFNSQDQLLLNFTVCNIRVLTEIFQAFDKPENSTIPSVGDLSSMEVLNQLGVSTSMILSPDQKIFEKDVHNVNIESNYESSQKIFEMELDDVEVDKTCNDEDEVDGLKNIPRGLSSATSTIFNSLKVISLNCDEHGTRGKKPDKEQMHIRLEGFDQLSNISTKRSACRLIRIFPSKNETDYCICCDINTSHGRKVVTLRSPLQVRNDLTVSVNIFCSSDELSEHGIEIIAADDGKHQYVQVGTVEPGKCYAVPLYIAYHCRLWLAPANMLYEMTTAPIWWQEFGPGKDRVRLILCPPQTPNSNNFFIKVKYEEDTSSLKQPHLPLLTPSATLRLSPSVVLHNLLPYSIHFSFEECALMQLSPGLDTPIYTADIHKQPKLQLQIINYMGIDWTGSLELTDDLEEFKAINMESDGSVDGQSKQLSLSIYVCQRQSMDLYVYSPYWILNKTSLPIQIRGSRSDAVYEYGDDTNEPLLFRFKKHRRKKAKVRVYNSRWTRSFSLDTVGSSGIVVCNDKERCRKYQFVLHVAMSQLQLTKIITILPYFLVVNCTSHQLRYMEDNKETDLWFDLQSRECCAFWPITESMKMCIKYYDSNVCSQHFSINVPHRTVLRMDRGTALSVDVAMTEGSMMIKILPYSPGDIPVRVDNFCDDVFLKLHQKSQGQVTLLSPNQSILYTWDDPTAERTLMWNVYNRSKPSYPAFISKNGAGEIQLGIQTVRRSCLLSSSRRSIDRRMKAERTDTVLCESSTDDDSDADVVDQFRSGALKNMRTDKVLIYWVSYLDGPQRVFLLTQDERIAKAASQVSESEHCDSALFVSFAGLGISLINGRSEELAYVTLSGSTATWEVETKKKSRWKKLPVELSAWLEERWQQEATIAVLPDIIEATFESNKLSMTKPENGALRRTYHPAVWFQYMQSEHNVYLHIKIHRLQIDNQLSDAYFPMVFYPSPIPSYIAKRNGPQPFAEFMLMTRYMPQYSLTTYKYVKLLVQESTVRLDKGFLTSVYDMYASSLQPTLNESRLLSEDISSSSRKLRDLITVYDYRKDKRILEYIHLSPLKVKLSLSLDGEPHLSSDANHVTALVTSNIVDFFLNSVSAKLADVNNVELRLDYFERQGIITSYDQLMDEMVNHYRMQALEHAYLVILGLDVLGNPYGLIRGLTQGFGDFYKPFMSSIQQPDKYAANLCRGVHSLLGHTITGFTGSAAAVTGSIGKALSFLSFDSDYKQRRRQLLLQKSDHLPSSLCVAGRSFVMGVALGLSGVVTSPMKGMQEKGIEGFLKGIGRGLMGFITKPTGGTVDMVSIAFDGIRRFAEMGEDITIPFRLPRFIHPTLGLKPFSTYHSLGAKILRSIDHGSYSVSDTYWAHAPLSNDDRADVVLVTDRRVLLLEKTRGWAEWTVEWTILLNILATDPFVVNNRLVFTICKDEAGSSGCWNGFEKHVESNDGQLLDWFCERVLEIKRQANFAAL